MNRLATFGSGRTLPVSGQFASSRSFVKEPCTFLWVLRSCFLLFGALQIALPLLLFERQAKAFVDPGSGFVFLQVAGSMFAGAIYYLRHRLKESGHVARDRDVSRPCRIVAYT